MMSSSAKICSKMATINHAGVNYIYLDQVRSGCDSKLQRPLVQSYLNHLQSWSKSLRIYQFFQVLFYNKVTVKIRKCSTENLKMHVKITNGIWYIFKSRENLRIKKITLPWDNRQANIALYPSPTHQALPLFLVAFWSNATISTFWRFDYQCYISWFLSYRHLVNWQIY